MTDVTSLLTQILSRLSTIEDKLAIPSDGAGSGSSAGDVPRSIKAFDSYLSEKLTPFHEVCTKLGGDAAVAGNIVKDAWQECRAFLLMATACKEPAQAALPGLLTKLGGKLKEISDAVNRNEWEKHTKTCSEGMACLNWYVAK
jgi:adenylyl cyclase-associated protein